MSCVIIFVVVRNRRRTAASAEATAIAAVRSRAAVPQTARSVLRGQTVRAKIDRRRRNVRRAAYGKADITAATATLRYRRIAV